MRNRRKWLAIPALVLVVLAAFTVTVFADDDLLVTALGANANRFIGSFWSLVPPLVAITLALITKEVYSSLFVGILVGALFYNRFNVIGTFDSIVGDGLIAAIEGTAGIFLFLVILGVLVALINKSGGSAAFGRWAQKHIRTRVGAILMTFFLGVLIFIDDYFNCLTVGSVMRPVTDSHKISRAKLAYIIDATAAPICMIAPISSWAAAVSDYTSQVGGTSSLALFCKAIPYNYYSLLTFVFIFAITLLGFDYGPMRTHEKNAENGDLFTFGSSVVTESDAETGSEKGRVFDLLIPVVVLVVLSVLALVYVGGFFSAGSEYAGQLFAAFEQTDATFGLPLGGLAALIFTMIYLVCRRVITAKDALACIPKGFIAMVPAILILTFATALKNMTNLLDASSFVNGIMTGAGESVVRLLPAIIFVVACVIAFATGTSWGTFAILIPIVLPIYGNDASNPLLIIGMSACLAGAVCGDHCSPISDTTIMSSAGAQCEHVNHVSTQLPYAITVAAVSFVSYIVAGFIENAWISLAIAAVLMLLTVFGIKFVTGRKAE